MKFIKYIYLKMEVDRIKLYKNNIYLGFLFDVN